MNEINFTVQLTPEALEAAADKLFKMAYGLSYGGGKLSHDEGITEVIPIEFGDDTAQRLFGDTDSFDNITVGNPIPDIPPTLTILSGDVELDSTGLPWDSRIHSEKKGKLVSGIWRLRRNVDKNIVPIVLEELKATMAASGITVSAGTPGAAATGVATTEATRATGTTEVPALTVVPTAPAPVAPVAPAAPTAPEAPTAPAAPEAPAMTFPQFVQKITDRSSAISPAGVPWGEQYTDEVQRILLNNDIAGVPLLMSRPDLIPLVNDEAEMFWNQIVAIEVN